jgi:hypothetical protein
LLTSSFDKKLEHPRTKIRTNTAKLTLGSLGLSIVTTVFNASMKTECRTKIHINKKTGHAHYLHITCVLVQRVDNAINDHTSYINNEMGGFKKELPNTISQTI